jgi:hypothetical protein
VNVTYLITVDGLGIDGPRAVHALRVPHRRMVRAITEALTLVRMSTKKGINSYNQRRCIAAAIFKKLEISRHFTLMCHDELSAPALPRWSVLYVQGIPIP